MNPSGKTTIIIIVLVILGGFCAYLIANNITKTSPSQPLNAESYGQSDSYSEDQTLLNKKTDILGQVVYSSDGISLGTLYDAYIIPEDGQISAISLNLSAKPNSHLVLIPIAKVSHIRDGEPFTLTLNKDQILDLPQQIRQEKELTGLISARTLSRETIHNADGQNIGQIQQLIFLDAALTTIIFQAEGVLRFDHPEPENHIFSIPLPALTFTEQQNTPYGSYLVKLNDEQTGALRAHMLQD